MSSAGSDNKISGSKIEPLSSDSKTGVPHDEGGGGAAGKDHEIDQARINPVGGRGVGQHPEPHADDQGVVGKDENIDKVKVDPLVSTADSARTGNPTGLPDEQVDASRVAPLGEVRQE